jgi:peptidoglycan/LPS O-acetylase OafA/YrhL
MLATFVIVNHWGPLQAHQNAPSFLANLTMVPHLFHREYVDAPYWTLQVEIRFYVLMFGLLVIRRGNLLVPFAAGWLALSTLDWFHKIPVLHVNLALDHAPFFAAGMIFSAIYRRGWKGTDGALLMGAYLLGCHRVVADLEEDIAGHGWPISTTVITISLAAFFVLFAAISLRKLALQKPRFWVTALGGITYPLYLLHNNIGMTLFNRWQPMMNRWVLLTVLLVGFISVAFVIWYFFERPVLRSLQGWRKRRRTPLAPNSDPSHAPLTNN